MLLIHVGAQAAAPPGPLPPWAAAIGDAWSRFIMLRANGDNTTLDLRNDDGEITCDEVNSIRMQLMPRRDPVRAHCP